MLSQTVKSSHWKFKLCDPQYKLTTDQAVDIAEAMMNDFMRKPGIGFQQVVLITLTFVLSADTLTGSDSHTGWQLFSSYLFSFFLFTPYSSTDFFCEVAWFTLFAWFPSDRIELNIIQTE